MLIHSVATWVGGATIVGTVEMVYTPSMGLIEAVTVTLAYSISFLLCKFTLQFEQ